MKINKLIYRSLILASIVLFSACQADDQTTITETKNISSIQTTQTKTAVEHTLADQTAYQGAQQLKDSTFCAKIEDENYKKQCETELADQTQLEAAVAKINTEDCRKISMPDKEKACELQIEIKMKQQQQSQELQLSYEEFNKFTNGGDYEKCKSLKDANLLTACEENILTNKALNSKEKNWCEKISNTEAQQRCLNAVKSFENK